MTWHLLPAAPAPGLALCRADEILDNAGRGFRFSDGPMQFAMFVVRQEGELHAYVNQCPHARHPLDFVENRFFTANKERLLCGSHGAEFDPQSGHCVEGPCKGKNLIPIPVEIRDGLIVIAETKT